MNGTILASKGFGDLVRQNVCEDGFDELKIALLGFKSEERDPDLLVDSDDFSAIGTRTELFAFGEPLHDKLRINVIGTVGPWCEGEIHQILEEGCEVQARVGLFLASTHKINRKKIDRSQASETPDIKKTVKNLSDAELRPNM